MVMHPERDTHPNPKSNPQTKTRHDSCLSTSSTFQRQKDRAKRPHSGQLPEKEASHHTEPARRLNHLQQMWLTILQQPINESYWKKWVTFTSPFYNASDQSESLSVCTNACLWGRFPGLLAI